MPDFKIEIPFFDSRASYLSRKKEIDDAIQEVLLDGDFINGKSVELFSSKLASYLKIEHVVPCANGTDALTLALMALELKKGDEVIVPNFNFIAAAEAISLLGLVPVFVDVNEKDFNIDCSLIERSITSKTKAIVVVHLFGAAAEINLVSAIGEKYELFIIEDVAQSLGSEKGGEKLGTFGHVSCTSFFPTKNLACFGDGGALFTKNPILAARLKMIANHGQREKYKHEVIGLNSRLDTLQAAILNVQLRYLDETIVARRAIAHQYHDDLSSLIGIELPLETLGTLHSFNQYCILLENEFFRNKLKAFLFSRGIATMIYYPKPTHLQPAFTNYNNQVDFPVTENLCSRILALPIFPTLTTQHQEYIIENIKDFFKNAN